MAATIESTTVVAPILKWLAEDPQAHALKVHGDVYTTVGTPDILACYHGRMLAVECKRAHVKRRASAMPLVFSHGEHSRAKHFWEQGAEVAQALQLQKWEQAGALAVVVTSLEELQQAVQSLC